MHEAAPHCLEVQSQISTPVLHTHQAPSRPAPSRLPAPRGLQKRVTVKVGHKTGGKDINNPKIPIKCAVEQAK